MSFSVKLTSQENAIIYLGTKYRVSATLENPEFNKQYTTLEGYLGFISRDTSSLLIMINITDDLKNIITQLKSQKVSFKKIVITNQIPENNIEIISEEKYDPYTQGPNNESNYPAVLQF